MSLTADRMLEIMKARDIVVRKHPSGTGWLPETSKGTRLGGKRSQPFATPEDAIEAAEKTYIETDLRANEADAARLFDVLSGGGFYAKPRTAMATIGGERSSLTVWDIFTTAADARIVSGERSLRAAVIEAEKTLAAPGGKAK